MASNDVLERVTVLTRKMPVSCVGRKPLGMFMYNATVAAVSATAKSQR